MKKLVTPILITAFIAGAISIFSTYANESLTDVVEDVKALTFESIDADGDGQISLVEAEQVPALVEEWSQLDTNKDNQLSSQEFEASSVAPIVEGVKVDF